MAKKETKDDLSEKKEQKFDFSKIDSALLSLKKDFGSDMCVSIEKDRDNWERVPCKSPTLGYIFGKGGTPRGAHIELYGPESGGKTLIALNIVADYQRAGYFATYIDTEYSFNADYARIQGVDLSPEKFILIHPDVGEEAFEAAVQLASTKQVGIIVIDSIATCLPKSEAEGSMEDQQMGAQARMIGKGVRKLIPAAGKSECTIIYINQIRMKIGVMFGNPETTPGGNAIKFASHIRCEVRKGEVKKDDKDSDFSDSEGIGIRIKNVKNKTSVPFRKGELYISFKDGLDTYSEYIEFAVMFGIIDKKGAWYSYNDTKIGQGKDNTIDFIKNNEDIFNAIKNKVDDCLANKTSIEKLDKDIIKEAEVEVENSDNLADSALD